MIFVYIKDGNIIKKSENRLQEIKCDLMWEVPYTIKDKLIIEDDRVIKYSESKQYKIDHKDDKEIEIQKKQLPIKEMKKRKQVSTFVKISQWIALLRNPHKNDKNPSTDMIRAENWWSRRWSVKPSKSRPGQ